MPVEIVHFLNFFIETENSCCAPRFLLIASCDKIIDSQTSFNGVLRRRCRSQKISEAKSRTFYLRLRNTAINAAIRNRCFWCTFKFLFWCYFTDV